MSANRIFWKDSYKYQLYEDYNHLVPDPSNFYKIKDFSGDFFSFKHPFLLIQKGYCWDGPSGPALDSDNFMRASLVHDVFYQAIREGKVLEKFRSDIDEEMQRICKQDGMSSIRSWYTYSAVRVFGYNATLNKDKDKVKCYPPLKKGVVVRKW